VKARKRSHQAIQRRSKKQREVYPALHCLQNNAQPLLALNALPATKSPNAINMEIRVAYEHSLASAPEEFIVQVPSQLVTDIPANVPRALLPEFIASLIVERSPTIGKIRNLKIL
jgi:hypothetical protein